MLNTLAKVLAEGKGGIILPIRKLSDNHNKHDQLGLYAFQSYLKNVKRVPVVMFLGLHVVCKRLTLNYAGVIFRSHA